MLADNWNVWLLEKENEKSALVGGVDYFWNFENLDNLIFSIKVTK